MVRLDSRFICDGSMVYLAVDHGGHHVCSANVKPTTDRSNAGKSIPYHADHVHGLHVVLPCGLGTLLDRQQ